TQGRQALAYRSTSENREKGLQTDVQPSVRRNVPETQLFQARVDRHGIPFGDRVSTKQTRNPPPGPKGLANPSLTWREKQVAEANKELMSPPYAKERKFTTRDPLRNKDLFSQRSSGQWRQKTTSEAEAVTEELGGDHQRKEISLSALEIRSEMEKEKPTRLKSVIVSPELVMEKETLSPLRPLILQTIEESLQEEETLMEFQNKQKRRTASKTNKRNQRRSPIILRGASSKKRKILQIQNSPGNGKRLGGEGSSKAPG
ncbi:unnamed protein product, partial [Brassica rapa]